MESKKILDHRITASSEFSADYATYHARLNNQPSVENKRAWLLNVAGK